MGELVTVLNAAGGAFVAFAAHMLVQSSVLIILLAALDLALRRRVKAVVRYWIWLLVLAKLILPPSLSSPTSPVSWIGGRLPETAIVSLVPIPVTEVREAVPPAVSTPRGTPPSSVGANDYSPLQSTGRIVAPSASSAAPVQPAVLPTWQALVLLGWAVVVIVMGVVLAQRALFIHRLVAQSRAPGPEIVELLGQCARRMGVRTDLAVKLSPLSASPSVCGLRRPVILIPEGMLSQLPVPELRSVLFHELGHIKRGDLWLNLLQAVLQVVYFYHPLLWAANVRIRRVREQAVDETVLAAMGDEAEDYPRTLLSVSRAAFGQPTVGANDYSPLLGVVESERALKDRIRHMVSRPFPKNARLGLLGLAAIAVIAAVLLPMARGTQTRPSETSQSRDRLHKQDNPELAELTRTDVANHKGAGEKETLEIPQGVTEGHAQVLSRDAQIAPIAVQASSSDTGSPADGAEGVGVNGLELTWPAGDKAKAQNVYLGVGPENLKLLGKVEQARMPVPHLQGDTKYYWRVDEVLADGSTVSGPVRTFTTGGLAAWWKLDEGSGDIARDSSGRDHRGTLHGEPQWVKDPSGGVLLFDGVDDYIDCGSPPSLMRVGSVSVAAWINLGAASRDAKIVSNQETGSGYKLGVYADKVEFEIRVRPDVTATTNRFEEGGTELQQDIWYHVVGVYEKGRYIRTYVNGRLDRDLKTAEIAAISKGPLVIGRESFAPISSKTYWWLGALRDVCVFTYALNADEVKALSSGATPAALAAAPVSSVPTDAKIALAPLKTRALLMATDRAKLPFSEQVTGNLGAWVKLEVLEQQVLALETLKPFSDNWAFARHQVVGLWSQKETLDHLQERLRDGKSVPIRLHIFFLPELKNAAEELRQKICTMAREAKVDTETEVRMEQSVWVGSGESPFYLREGKIRTYYPGSMPRPDGGRRWLTNGLVDPNDLEQHILWRLTMPKNVPLTFRIEYDEASYQLAKQVAETAKAVTKRVGLTELVGVTGTLAEAVPESAFLGKWQALGSGVIQSVDIQPAGVCQVLVGEGSSVLQAGTSVKGTWSWTVKEILLDIKDPVMGRKGYPPYIYRASLSGAGDLVIQKGEVWPQGSFMHTRPPETTYKKVP